MVYSDSDFERFYIRYMAEAMPRGESIQAFCSRNKVPYNLFDKWYRDTRHKIEPLQVTGMPQPERATIKDPQPEQPVPTDSPLRIMIDIRMSNGLRVQQRNLSYRQLVKLVGSLEELC